MSARKDNGTMVYFTEDREQIGKALALCNIAAFAGQMVAVKLHMGEPGNPYIVKPELARSIVDSVRGAGGVPFLLDSVVAYAGERSYRRGYEKVAQRHGFTHEAMGCEVIIADEGVRVVEAGVALEVVTPMYDSQCMVVLSHVKGHIQAGFGGAIKNLGMGGVTKASKNLIHHNAEPVHNPDECTLCGICAEACPMGAISVDDEWHIDRDCCPGCGKCVLSCNTGALTFKVMSLNEGLAISARACTAGKTALYVNSLHNIADVCDCDPNPRQIICPDIGYLIGADAAAVDAATLDIIDAVRPGVFKQSTGVDPRPQVSHAVALGMNDHYSLQRL
ncbi:MAG: DUF362 domain-containing protein [Dehalococcoidia bacterium]|nr:DUF362 domain-containing protein [Dehalococcoidia bacterium]